MVLSFIPALLLRRRSEFPHAVVPNVAFGLAQRRKLRSAPRGRTPFTASSSSKELQGGVEATRVLTLSRSQQHGVTCD